jgi:hypothetical protein
LDNVFAAAGVYLAPRDLIEAQRWAELAQSIRTAIAVATPQL